MKRKLILCSALFLVVFLIAGVYDLSISLALTSDGPLLLGTVGERIAPLPAFVILGVCAVALQKTHKKNVFYSLTHIVASVWGGVQCAGFHTDAMRIVLCVWTAAGLYVLTDWLGKKMDCSNKRVEELCCLGLYATIFAFCTVSLLKVLWGRPRFLSLMDPSTQFVPWYELHGPVLLNDLHKSFPSGHTVSAAAILWITTLPYAYTKCENRKGLLTVFAWVWLLLSAVSRIIAGKHFATDVLAAMGIYLLVFTLLRKKFLSQIEE